MEYLIKLNQVTQYLVLFSCTIFLCYGCSVNGYGISGISERKVYKTPMIQIVKTKSTGLNLFTEGSFGLQLGSIERQLIYPVITKNTDLCINTILNKASPLHEDSGQSAKYLNEPVHIDTQWKGGGIDISPFSFMISLGVGHKQSTRILSGKSFSMYYNNSLNHAELCSSFKSGDTK